MLCVYVWVCVSFGFFFSLSRIASGVVVDVVICLFNWNFSGVYMSNCVDFCISPIMLFRLKLLILCDFCFLSFFTTSRFIFLSICAVSLCLIFFSSFFFIVAFISNVIYKTAFRMYKIHIDFELLCLAVLDSWNGAFVASNLQFSHYYVRSRGYFNFCLHTTNQPAKKIK